MKQSSMVMISLDDYSIKLCVKCKTKLCNCFEADVLIADTIILLNKKGFSTNFCCAGHAECLKYDMYSTYVVFASVPSEVLKYLPRLPHNMYWETLSASSCGIYMKKHRSSKRCLGAAYPQRSVFVAMWRYYIVWRNNRRLYNWVYKLKNFNEYTRGK